MTDEHLWLFGVPIFTLIDHREFSERGCDLFEQIYDFDVNLSGSVLRLDIFLHE